MAYTYRTFLKKGLDLAPLGIAQCPEAYSYFCTPKGARILGWAGVDGIHFCFIRGFGEMVFAVSPMNPSPHFVHPLARNFGDFLSLLLSCGHSAPLEQAWQWDEEQFQAFLAKNPPTQEQQELLSRIARQTGLAPMARPWQYLRQLQESFDDSKIPYTEDFYDLDMNPDAPQPTPEWAVTFTGGFWSRRGKERPGKELSVGAEFYWAGHHWLIPSVYVCGKGLVVDFCMRSEAGQIRSFMEKWDLTVENEGSRQFTQEQRMQLEQDNPLHLDFTARLLLNGKELSFRHGCGMGYNPCLPSEYSQEPPTAEILAHYGLDPHFGWMVHRMSFPWATRRKPELRSLSVTMIQEEISLPGPHFRVNKPGDTVSFSHNGGSHVLTVQEYEAQTMDWKGMTQPDMEYPCHYTAMSYTVVPELQSLSIADCDDGDQPRPGHADPCGPTATNRAAVIGIIGGADGPTVIQTGTDTPAMLHAACSSLHFAPADPVEWRMVFREKPFADKTIPLLEQ